MKITEIKFQNILSFNDFTWPDIDDGFNVIVWPNGAGKSNDKILNEVIKKIAEKAKENITLITRKKHFQDILLKKLNRRKK